MLLQLPPFTYYSCCPKNLNTVCTGIKKTLCGEEFPVIVGISRIAFKGGAVAGVDISKNWFIIHVILNNGSLHSHDCQSIKNKIDSFMW